MPAPKHAYMLRYLNGDMEPCEVVYARTELGARRKYRVIDNAEIQDTEVERRPEFDQYEATGGPTTEDLFLRHAWYFACADCHEEMVTHEDDPDAVVVGRHAVRCGACVAKARAA